MNVVENEIEFELQMSQASNMGLSILLMKKVNFFYPIEEAIINSILAGATEVFIDITRGNNSTDSSHFNIQKISVVDNGCGFITECRKSFNEIAKSNKQNCKGIGRLSYFRVFDKVTIESFFDENNAKKMLRFDYDATFNEINDNDISDSDKTNNKTSVVFTDIKKEYLNDESIYNDDQQIINQLKQRILPSLIYTKCVVKYNNIDITLKNAEWLEYKEKGDNNLNQDIIINGHLFTIKYTLQNQDKHLFLCLANKRAVKALFSLNNLESIEDKKLIVIIESDFFNVTANPTWDGFSGEGTDDFQSMLKTLKIKVIDLLEMLGLTTRIEQNKDEVIKNRPDLKDLVNQVNKWKSFESASDLQKEALKLRENVIQNLYKSDDSGSDFDFNDAKDSKILDAAMKSVLSDLMLFRYETLKKFSSLCEKNVKEDILHNILFKKGGTNKTESSENLWLIDARLSYSQYISSDNTIKKTLLGINEVNNDKLSFTESVKKNNIQFSNFDDLSQDFIDELNKEPDIAIFNDDSVVIIELKKPDVDLMNHVYKVQYYAQLIAYLHQDKYKRFYCYLVGGNLPPYNDAHLTIDNMGRFITKDIKVTTIKDGHQKDNTLDATMYFEVCTYKKFAKDCYLQHHKFFQSIGKKIDALEKYIPNDTN